MWRVSWLNRLGEQDEEEEVGRMSHAGGEEEDIADDVEVVESWESDRDMAVEEMLEVGEVKKCIV